MAQRTNRRRRPAATGLGAVAMVLTMLAACSSSSVVAGKPAAPAHPTGGSAAPTTRDGVKVVAGVGYSSGDCPGRGKQTRKADLYLPEQPASSPAPVVVLVHGGGFVGGSRDKRPFPEVAAALARQGWAAVSIDYCLPPRGTAGFPVELNDVKAAVGYLREHAAQYVLDPTRMATWGGSAGATLAVQAAALLAGTDTSVAAAVGWSGPYDFTDVTGAGPRQVKTVANYLGCTDLRTAKCMTTAKQASVVDQVDAGTTPPVLLANSTDELVPLGQLTAMQKALESAGVTVRTLVMPGTEHAMGYTDAAFCPTVEFLQKYLGKTTRTCVAPS